MSQTSIAILGIILTFAYFLSNVIFKTGHLSARVEELEKYRGTLRQDMHEISDRISAQSEAIRYLTTVIEERTERRKDIRNNVNNN